MKGEGIEGDNEGGLCGGWLCFPALAGNSGFSSQSVPEVSLSAEARLADLRCCA